jgi:cytochrome c peroxidase
MEMTLGAGKYDFRVPPLRNVALSAPYMHNGAFQSLDQVVEHYDMIVESLRSYNLVNEWENYIEKLANHDHATDEARILSLSPILVLKLEFEEEEEEALVEFLTYGLTDVRLINRIPKVDTVNN